MSEITLDSSNKKARLGRGLGSLFGEQASIRQQQEVRNETKAAELKKEDSPAPAMPISEKVEAQTQATSSAPPPATASMQLTAIPVPPAATEVNTKDRIWKVPVDKMKASSFQPRRSFEKEKLEELAQSIKASGILQPILTRRKSDGTFEIIAGERRWRAAQLAGLHEVPVIVREFDELTALEVALIENIQREDLNPIEEAEAYFRLATEFRLTQAQVAEKVGKDRVTVANTIRLLQLEPSAKELLIQGKLSQGHAKILLSLPQQSAQRQLAERIVKENLTVRQLEKAIKEMMNPIPSNPAVGEKDKTAALLVKNLEEEVQKSLSTKVNIAYNKGKGQLVIHFYSDDELTELTTKLRGLK